eukprot:PhF_6_TR26670/c0_g1_i1/m.38759/K00927/PGK, pgk; phosphoglycerate kinase
MSSAILEKKSIEDIWPINKKRFFIRVDFNVVIKDSKIVDDLRINAVLPTIKHVIEKGGIAIIASHCGRPRGIDMRKVNAKSRDAILATWEAEKGTGMTNYFASLTGPEKVEVLKLCTTPPTKLEAARSSGKTVFFSALSFEEKKRVLDAFTERTKRQLDRQDYEFETTLKPVAAYLQTALGTNVQFAPDPCACSEQIRRLKSGDVCVLENLRFYSNETSSSEEERMVMTKMLSCYADYYVLDAFGTMHRASASLVELPKAMLHGACGYLVEKELKKVSKAFSNPVKPFALVLGGNKFKDVVQALDQVINRVDKVILVGAVGLLFLKASGKSIGSSVVDETLVGQASALLSKAKALGVSVILPSDHVATTSIGEGSRPSPTLTSDADVQRNLYAVDIGPQTIANITKELRPCRTVVWVGAAGMTNVEPFHEGTVAIAKALTMPNIFSIAGGRSSVKLLQQTGYASSISHVSTGGTTLLQLLSSRALPALKNLTERARVEGASSEYTISVTDHFRTLPLFSGCSEKLLATLVKRVWRKTYQNGDVLIQEGDRQLCMFVISQGNVNITSSLGDDKIAFQGDSIGMMSFLNNEPSTITATASGSVTAYLLSSATFEDLGSSVPGFTLEVAQNMCKAANIRNNANWSIIADGFDRTPAPVVSHYRGKSNVASKATQLVCHVASSVGSKLLSGSTFSDPDLYQEAIEAAALHVLYHPFHKYVKSGLSIRQSTNPLVRVLVAQDVIAALSFCASFSSTDVAYRWIRMGVQCLCNLILQCALLHGTSGHRCHGTTTSSLATILSSVIVSLAFNRSLSAAGKASKEAAAFALVFMALYKPVFTLMDRLIQTTGLKRSALARQDYN